MLRVIINADDLGISHNVNSAIAEGFAKGILTSSSIIANSNTWPEVEMIVKSNPDASFGVHLNLTEGPSLSKNPVLFKYCVIDENGNFSKKITERNVWPKELLNAIFEEWDLQVQMVAETHQVPITHFDGHHHVHTLYFLRDILIQLCNRYNVFKVRNTYRLPKRGLKKYLHLFINMIAKCPSCSFFVKKMPKNKKLLSLTSLLRSYSWMNLTKSLEKPDYFTSYESALNIIPLSNILDNNILELMCHPGHDKYRRETDLLMKRTIFDDELVHLISYKDI